MTAAARHPGVSVVVPCYDQRPANLERLLLSLGKQDYPGPREIILVDNHPQPALRIPLQVAGLRLLHEPEPGSYAARNAALRVASGEIIAFTDSDCECASDWLSRGVARLQLEAEAGIVGGLIRPSPCPSGPCPSGKPGFAARYDIFFHMRQQHYVTVMQFAATANAFVRRELFENIGLFNPQLRSGGDREWCGRAVAAGYRLAWEPAAVVLHDTRSLAGLFTKARRLAGQQWCLARLNGAGVGLAARQELDFFRARLQRLLDRQEPLTLADRAGFFLLASLLQGLRFLELAWLSLTRAGPERR